MGFLQSFLRRHFVEKSVIALQNVGCFLRPFQTLILESTFPISNQRGSKTIWSCTYLYSSYKAAPSTLSPFSKVSTPGMYPTKFYTRRLGSEVQPITLLYSIFDTEKVTFCIPSVDTFLPLCIPFECCKCTHCL